MADLCSISIGVSHCGDGRINDCCRTSIVGKATHSSVEFCTDIPLGPGGQRYRVWNLHCICCSGWNICRLLSSYSTLRISTCKGAQECRKSESLFPYGSS